MGSVKSILPTDFPSLGVPWLMGSLAALYARAKIADRLPPLANVAISNVPGPAFPLYLAGAKMLTNYPTSIVVHGVALNITVQTYNESLEFGLIACGEAMPDVAELARHVQAAFDEFQALPASVVAEAVPLPKAAEPVVKKLTELFRPLPPSMRRTITFDNGTEFAYHHRLHKLSMRTFFCDAHAPWQKGGIENAIGRMRRGLPRKTDLATLSDDRLLSVVRSYNHTPRKCLNFKTPAEVLTRDLLHFKCESTRCVLQ